MRSAVSRTAKGYSVEATLDMGTETIRLPDGTIMLGVTEGEEGKMVAILSSFQITSLQEHMAKLEKAFPREDTA